MKKYIQQFSQWLKPSKSYSINKTSKSFTCKEDRGTVGKKIWTDEQEKDLNQRFGEVHKRIDDLHTEMNQKFEEVNRKFDEVNRKFELLFELLARNGIK